MNSEKNKPTDSRHLSRILAVGYFFSIQSQNELTDISESLAPLEPNSIADVLEEGKYNTKLYTKIVEGTESNLKIIDKTITKMAPSWPLDQINPVDLAILRISIWEAFIGKINPEKVVINEAIELGKEMGSLESGSFINGVLGGIINNKKVKQKLESI